VIQEKVDVPGFLQGDNRRFQTDLTANMFEELGVLFLGDSNIVVFASGPHNICERNPDISSIVRQYDVVTAHFFDSV